MNPTIFGDGLTSRDFTFVENVVQANIKSLLIGNLGKHEIFNVACEDQISLIEIVQYLAEISGNNLKPIFKEERKGDIKHSKASISKISSKIGYKPEVYFAEGLKFVYDWYKENSIKNI
jgi:UDP-N-acetylglucosamine 4-epimerase